MNKNSPISKNPAKTANLPRPADFRVWLREALDALELSPYALAVDLEIGRNTVAHFLASEKGDIRLGTAHRLYNAVVRIAKTEGVTIPSLIGWNDAP